MNENLPRVSYYIYFFFILKNHLPWSLSEKGINSQSLLQPGVRVLCINLMFT